MPVIINRCGQDLKIPEIQKIIPFDGKQYIVPDFIFLKYRSMFELVPIELQQQLKKQEEIIKQQKQIIKELKSKSSFYDAFKICQVNIINKPFDFLYSFHFDQNIEEAINRLKISIKSIINQNVNVCVCNTSVKCIKKYLIDFPSIKYIHLPEKVKVYCKSKIINLGVKELVSSKYFFLSDIDLVYPPTFIEYMSLFTLVKNPIRVIFSNHNLDFTKKIPQNYEECKKSFELSTTNHKFFAPGNGLVHLSSFNKVGGFDERFVGHGSEDSEFNYRISKINKYYQFDLEEINTFHLFHKSQPHVLKQINFNEQMWRYIIWKGETEKLPLIKAGEIQFPKGFLKKDWSLGKNFV